MNGKIAEVLNSANVQRIDIAYAAGTNMPRHIATSDAYLVIEQGSALLIYADTKQELDPGIVTLIPANEQHMLKVIDDLKGYILLTKEATIKYFSFEPIEVKPNGKSTY
ncbi:hypothetical protein [Mucilaginibacter antarcticus]|uniref:Uncharacterized protein n=1 Tax=Mucilaginibacter antarcticus TaxID=1855725 RepID=A0ABW5XUR5_9SPHI